MANAKKANERFSKYLNRNDFKIDTSKEFQPYIYLDNNEIYGINSKSHLAEATSILNKKIIQKH